MGSRRLRTLAADGVRRDGCPGHHRASGPHLDRHGDGLGPRGDRRGDRRVGGVGVRSSLQLHAAQGRGAGHRGRGDLAARYPRHDHRAAAGSTDSGGRTMTIATDRREPSRVSGGEGDTGHLEELRRDPIALMNRVRSECGDIGIFELADRDVVLMTGASANEFFFRAPEEQLDQAEAYPFMTPIFGEGVVFDASPERRREMLHNQALRDKFMRGHAATIADEVEQMVAGWDDKGEIDLLDWLAELTIYTSSACLVGKRFRRELDKRFAQLYHDLEQGTDAIAYVDPYAPIESFRRRDAARVGLVELVQGIMERRAASAGSDGPGSSAAEDDRDLLDVLMSITNEDGTPRFLANEVTGMFISMMFAGHHTTSGTAAWTLIELL